MSLKAALILTRYNVEASARIATEKLRGTVRRIGP